MKWVDAMLRAPRLARISLAVIVVGFGGVNTTREVLAVSWERRIELAMRSDADRIDAALDAFAPLYRELAAASGPDTRIVLFSRIRTASDVWGRYREVKLLQFQLATLLAPRIVQLVFDDVPDAAGLLDAHIGDLLLVDLDLAAPVPAFERFEPIARGDRFAVLRRNSTAPKDC